MIENLERDEYVVPDESDSELAATASRILARSMDRQISVRMDDGLELALPKSVTELLVRMLTELSNGNMVSVVPIHAELTTQEAANHLNVSRPFLIKLLEQKALPFHKVGSHRRIKFTDLRAFQTKFASERETAMEQLASDAQELGLGY